MVERTWPSVIYVIPRGNSVVSNWALNVCLSECKMSPSFDVLVTGFSGKFVAVSGGVEGRLSAVEIVI